MDNYYHKRDSEFFGREFEFNLIEEYEENKKITAKEAFLNSLEIGYLTLGGRDNHISQIQKTFVQDKRQITLNSFKSILSLAQSLPGSTSTQVIACISAVKTETVIGTVLGTLGYILPGLIGTMLLSALIFYSSDYVDITGLSNKTHPFIQPTNNLFLFYFHVAFAGINQGTLGLLLLTAVLWAKRTSDSIFHLSLILFSATSYYYLPTFPNMIIIMLISGIISFMYVDQNYIMTLEEFKIKIHKSSVLGKSCFIVYLIIYLIIISAILLIPGIEVYTYIIERFYRMGSIAFGGYSAAPFILTEFSYDSFISETDILTAFSLMNFLPGPMFNVSVFIGTFIYGPISGFISVIFLVTPGILFILWALPKIQIVKKSYALQRFLSGVSSSGIGFIFTAVFKLWISACLFNPYSNQVIGTLNFLSSGIIHSKLSIGEPYVLLINSMVSLLFRLIFNI